MDAALSDEETLRLLFAAAGDGYFDLNPVDGSVAFSAEWKSALGFRTSELRNHFSERIARIHADDVQRINEDFDNFIRGPETRYSNSHRIRHRDGHYMWALERGLCIRDERGVAQRIICVQTIVSAVKMTEDAMEAALSYAMRNEVLLRETGRMAQVGGWELEIPGGAHWSDEVYDIHEFSNRERTPQTLEDWAAFIAADARESTLATWQEAVKNAGSWDMQLPFVTATGKNIWVRSIGRVQMTDRGTIRVFGALQDITVSKKVERELQAAHALAMKASNIKSQFLANMSHEVRTPLNGILGMTALALETELGGEQREYLEIIQKSGLALLKIVDDILDISKIEAGKMTFEREPFNAAEALYDATRSVCSAAEAKGVAIVFDLQPTFPSLLVGDGVRFRQLASNLLTNAVKFTAKGEVIVRLTYDSAAERLNLVISDSGIGIAQDRLEQIFEAFTQADGSTTRKFGGTGLGLTICRELASRMGGSIHVESELGAGSTFTVFLPLPIASNAPRPAPIRGVRVLVIEDSVRARAALCSHLGHWGVEFVEAHDLKAGTRLIEQAFEEGRVFDVVFIPHGRSESAGLDFASALQRDDRFRGVTKILMVGMRTRVPLAELENAGISSQLVRPLAPSSLRAVLVDVQHGAKTKLPAKSPGSERKLRVLVAEDNAINAKLAIKVLEKLGHEVKHVENGKEALVATERDAFDVILMDVQMPEMDGLEATRQIRQREKLTGGHINIIALTANAMKGDDKLCLDAGMDAYLTKPLQTNRLAEVLLSMLLRISSAE